MWILIMIIVTDHGVSNTSVEFKSKVACATAAEAFYSESRAMARYTSAEFCVRK
jgi:hypothetical protein